MTAPSTVGTSADAAPGAPTALTVDIPTALKRADRAWCGDRNDEPLDAERVHHLAAGIATRLDFAAGCTHPDAEQLRAEIAELYSALELMRRERNDARAQLQSKTNRAVEHAETEHLLAELQQQIDTQEQRAQRAENERDELRAEVEQLRHHTSPTDHPGLDHTETQRTIETLQVLRRACGDLASQLERIAPAPPAAHDEPAEQQPADDQPGPAIGPCSNCRRPMLPQRLWKNRPDLRPGHARVGARGRCNSCYGNAIRKGQITPASPHNRTAGAA